jgi:redox-sensitive bicupin YhaK (pirin superfamily)
LLFLACAEISEPVITRGPFIVNDQAQIQAPFTAFQELEMGHFAPRPDNRGATGGWRLS